MKSLVIKLIRWIAEYIAECINDEVRYLVHFDDPDESYANFTMVMTSVPRVDDVIWVTDFMGGGIDFEIVVTLVTYVAYINPKEKCQLVPKGDQVFITAVPVEY